LVRIRDYMQEPGNRPDRLDGRYRHHVTPGATVDIVQKQDQGSGKKIRGIVLQILTNSSFHPHGIKVRLKDGKIGRVGAILVMDSQ
jgi:uncharacterized repeat protein (TIGR03833 family)